MAKSNASEMLTSLDSLFTTQEQRDEAKRDSVQDIPISQISDFPEHPFKVKQDEAMLEMAESVRQYGVLVPGLVRQLDDGSYQMVSGHRRKMASELAGRDTIPCSVRDLTDDEAVIIMVDSNLQRERVLPSEKAFAYKMKLDAMRRQAGRPSKENGVPLGHHFQQGKSREILADNSPDSNTQIQRYIRLTNLGPDGTMQDVVTFRDTVSDPMYAYLHLKVGYGSVKIIKTSEDGEVSGISFTVSGNGTEQTVTTNADGEMQLDDLRPGVYTVTEQSNDRYEPQEVRQVTVISGQVATVAFHNMLKRGSLEVVKTAEDGLNEGVKFHLTGTSLAGLSVDEYAVTGSNGKAVFSDVLIGKDYILSEVDTDIRYVVPEDQTTAVEWNTVTQAEVRNVLKKWSATVTKRDAETGLPQGDATLAGAVYGVYRGEKLVDTYTTDESGQFTTTDYVCGEDWTIRELSPSEGYLLDDTVYPVGAEPQRYTAEYNPIALDVTEQVIRGGVNLTKVDKDYPENKLEGAVFEVYRDSNRNQELNDEDELLGTMEDLGGGEYALTGLCYGGYFAKETKAPEGFYLDESAYYFAITTDGETVTVENEAGKGFLNAAQVGSLRIVKTSSDGKLAGFSFRVTGANGYDQVFQTDAEGVILIEGLRIGDYTVSEVRDGSSDGYLLPADKTASIFEGAVTEVEMHNEKKPTPKVPQTGDSSHAALWLALLGLSGIGAVTVLLMRKRKK